MSKVQAGCLTALGFSTVFHLARYFSPASLVSWGSEPMTASIGTIFGNSDTFGAFGVTMHPIIPLFAYIAAALLVICMQKIEDAINNRAKAGRQVRSQLIGK